MRTRRQARELALQTLFFLDMNHDYTLEQGIESFCLELGGSIPESKKIFFLDLVHGVMENITEIDALMERYSTNWKVFRMSVVDRNVMRIAIFELLKQSDIPSGVSINEAVDIGKKYGTKDSGSFINGILDKIRSELETLNSQKSL